MPMSDWSSDVFSSDLMGINSRPSSPKSMRRLIPAPCLFSSWIVPRPQTAWRSFAPTSRFMSLAVAVSSITSRQPWSNQYSSRSEEHTPELQSLMRTSYAVFCFKKKTPQHQDKHHQHFIQ